MSLNWLIWLPGWFFGFSLVDKFITIEAEQKKDILGLPTWSALIAFFIKLLLWTMAWIWIYWRFIN